MKMVFFVGVSIIWGSHPLIMMVGLVVLVLSLFVYFYVSSLSFWMGYLLVLVMLSGILVVFSYMLSLVPNLSFEYFNMVIPICFGFVLFKFMSEFGFLDMSVFSQGVWLSSVSFITFYLVGLLLLLMVVVLFLSVMDSGSLRVG